MKALILLDPASVTEPGDYRAAWAASACHSMGIDVSYMLVTTIAQSDVTHINNTVAKVGADMVVIPAYNSVNRNYVDNAMDGNVTVPVFVLGVVNTLGNIKGVQFNTFYDSGATFAAAQISRTSGAIYSNTRRAILDTVSAPEQVAALITGAGADASAIVAWKWSPDGSKWVYHTTSEQKYGHLHLLVDEAVRDGVLAPPPMRAPIILNIDHINDGGDNAGSFTGGFQGQPDKVATLGAILRQAGGVCYASLERRWIINNPGDAPESGQTTGTLLTNLKEYADVFRYIATHDHGNLYVNGNAPGDAIYNQRAKTSIDQSHTDTKNAITGLGLKVDPVGVHFAVNRVGPYWFELNEARNVYTADPNNAAPKVGYSYQVARVSVQEDAGESYPYIKGLPFNTSPPPLHWLKQPTRMRGTLCYAVQDGGTDNGSASSLSLDMSAFGRNLISANCGLTYYHHGTDFEDASQNPGGLVSDGTAHSRGLLAWQTGWAYAQACGHTVKFGANFLDYL